MKITIEFTTDNAAFKDDVEREVERVLRRALQPAIEMANGDLRDGDSPLLDTNGNKIGSVSAEVTK